MSKLQEKFGNRIKTLRHQHDMTQEQLAETTELSVEFISLIERGVNSPSFKTLQVLADAFNIEVFKLFEFDN